VDDVGNVVTVVSVVSVGDDISGNLFAAAESGVAAVMVAAKTTFSASD
jgi:hypothetical protein